MSIRCVSEIPYQVNIYVAVLLCPCWLSNIKPRRSEVTSRTLSKDIRLSAEQIGEIRTNYCSRELNTGSRFCTNDDEIPIWLSELDEDRDPWTVSPCRNIYFVGNGQFMDSY